MADIILKAVKSSLVMFWSNHYGSEEVTLNEIFSPSWLYFLGDCICSGSICKYRCRDVSEYSPLACPEFVVQEKCFLWYYHRRWKKAQKLGNKYEHGALVEQRKLSVKPFNFLLREKYCCAYFIDEKKTQKKYVIFQKSHSTQMSKPRLVR